MRSILTVLWMTLSAVVVKPPEYFTKVQYEKNLGLVSPTPDPASEVSSFIAMKPSPSPTPIPIIKQIEIPSKLETPYGEIIYSGIIEEMWAVSYDSSCAGCSDTTATGMKQGYGVVAVDPKVIPLYTKVYVPGYGIGIAGDVGGGVKGKIIDLGYDKLEGQWSARFVDVYILSE